MPLEQRYDWICIMHDILCKERVGVLFAPLFAKGLVFLLQDTCSRCAFHVRENLQRFHKLWATFSPRRFDAETLHTLEQAVRSTPKPEKSPPTNRHGDRQAQRGFRDETREPQPVQTFAPRQEYKTHTRPGMDHRFRNGFLSRKRSLSPRSSSRSSHWSRRRLHDPMEAPRRSGKPKHVHDEHSKPTPQSRWSPSPYLVAVPQRSRDTQQQSSQSGCSPLPRPISPPQRSEPTHSLDHSGRALNGAASSPPAISSPSPFVPSAVAHAPLVLPPLSLVPSLFPVAVTSSPSPSPPHARWLPFASLLSEPTHKPRYLDFGVSRQMYCGGAGRRRKWLRHCIPARARNAKHAVGVLRMKVKCGNTWIVISGNTVHRKITALRRIEDGLAYPCANGSLLRISPRLKI